jgi:maleate isomerase
MITLQFSQILATMKTRRQFISAMPLTYAATQIPGLTSAQALSGPAEEQGRTIEGALSKKPVFIPNLDRPPMPQIAESGMVSDDVVVESIQGLDKLRGYPDVLSSRLKLGLLIPATNTSMEAELWHILSLARSQSGMDGVGLHTSNVMTTKPVLRTASDLESYKRQFLGGLKDALAQSLLAQPHCLILGMSLEHIIDDLDALKAPISEIGQQSSLFCATWHEAATFAINAFKARRIGLLTPFDANGNRNARAVFNALGFEVVSTFGFACANALHIAHVPDEAKKEAIVRHLATPETGSTRLFNVGQT